MKHLLTLTFLSISIFTFAQIPSYIPTNGLVGWWPFNGNANDESGNGNNGIVNGAVLTNDRNGVASSAYVFAPASNSNINIPFSNSLNTIQTGITLSAWIYMDGGTPAGTPPRILELRGAYGGGGDAGFVMLATDNNNTSRSFELRWYNDNGNSNLNFSPTNNLLTALNWHLISFTADGGLGVAKYYYDGVLQSTSNNSNITLCNYNNNPLIIGAEQNLLGKWGGKLDDIGIWNRALTEAEILGLYEGCQLAITTQPQDQSVATSVGTASFTAASSSSNASYQWQTNLGLGYQNLSNAGQYSGAISSALTVSNLSLSNNNQVFRCVVNEGTCADTTAEATLTIIDDAGINLINEALIGVYPNPVQDILFVKGITSKEFEYEVLSIDGKLLQKGKSQGEITVKELRKGNYVLRVGQQQVSFVKQ